MPGKKIKKLIGKMNSEKCCMLTHGVAVERLNDGNLSCRLIFPIRAITLRDCETRNELAYIFPIQFCLPGKFAQQRPRTSEKPLCAARLSA